MKKQTHISLHLFQSTFVSFRNVLLSQTEYFFLSILISIISLLIFLSLSFHCISRQIVCIYESQNGSQNTTMDDRILLLYLPNSEYIYTMDDMQLRTKTACLCTQWLGWGWKDLQSYGGRNCSCHGRGGGGTEFTTYASVYWKFFTCISFI